MNRKVVINCALPYANGPLHIGHIAGAYLSGDIFNRYQRMIGNEVMFICGSDEYGTPISIQAEKEKVSPKEIVEKYHREHRKTMESIDIFFDYFGRTTDPEHSEFVEDFFRDLEKSGYLEKRKMISAYCPNEGRFLPDRYVNGTCPRCGYENARGDQCDECGRTNDPQDLINPRCAICGSPAEFRETDHVFFLASKLEGRIREWLEGKKEWRENVRSFSLNMIQGGLKDRAITRDIDWGVPAPMEGMEGKRIYVWFEALLGYLSFARKYSREKGESDYWLNMYSGGHTFYFLGKDNIFFHAILLPAMHMASGKYPLPERVDANEYLRFNGQKFSKSRGIGYSVDDILKIVDKDSLRFYLSSILPESSDSDFTLNEMKEKVNSELNGKYGNLVNRVISFAEGKGIHPEYGEGDDLDSTLEAGLTKFLSSYLEAMERLEFRRAISLWLEAVKSVNSYFNDAKPWDMVKNHDPKVSARIWHSLKAIEYLTVTIYPFVPSGAERVWDSLHGVNMPDLPLKHLEEVCTFSIRNTGPVFKKIEIEEEEGNELNLVVGKIIMAENHPNADSLLHLKVDLGFNVIDLVAGIKKYYDLKDLEGKKIIVVKNLKHSKIRGIESQGMLLAAQDSRGAHLLTSDEKEGTEVLIGEHRYSGEGKISIDDLKRYDLKADNEGLYPTAVIGRDRLYMTANGKRVYIDEKVEGKSQIR
ncbi:MAG: methionine--tRNA ligase [Candidatus Thermoplasmatota archaeon]|nr:methionine--tRNA ligase [Candidatus Thermoplasmatota archaeon]MCL5790989.1 methionine--tRNA ligase [Candidatus Thermoplasmatota archaeon]